MSPPSIGKAAALAALLVAAPIAAHAQPLVIQPGQDGFQTRPGSQATLPAPLPPGFFGAKGGNLSDLVPAGLVLTVGPGPDLVAIPVLTTFLTGPGCHTGSVNVHCYEQQRIILVPIYDTVVERLGTSLAAVGSTDVVGIKLVHLSLKTITPITVTYGGGAAPSSLFDLIISLNGPQPEGALTLHRTGATNGTMDTVLPVNYRIDFVGRDPSDPSAASPLFFSEVLQSQGNTFGVVPEPRSVALLALGVLTMGAGAWRRRAVRTA